MKNILLHTTHAGFSNEEIESTAQTIAEYTAQLQLAAQSEEYDGKEGAIYSAFDSESAKSVESAVKAKLTPNIKYIVVIGIGGSNLGSKAVSEAINGNLAGYKMNKPHIIFADTVAPSLHKSMQEIMEKQIQSADEILIILISKSGTTTEVVSNFDYIYGYLSKRIQKLNERVLVVTETGSKLYEAAQKQSFDTLEHPLVGGRYSIFTSVGQTPLRALGLDVDQLLLGAQEMRDRCLTSNVHENPALRSAVLLYLHQKNGKCINDNFFFNPELESLGKWYRQLMGESIGKSHDVQNNEVHAGILPTVSIGSVDLHSMVQLYLGGPRNIFTNLVYCSQSDAHIMTHDNALGEIVPGIHDRNMSEIMDAIYEGVKIAYTKNKLPFMEVEFPEISEHTLGQYLQMKMIEMMYLAKLLGVNPFDQPNVEDYKKETREILGS